MGRGYMCSRNGGHLQDNLSCMARIKRDGPGSERFRHVIIRHFSVSKNANRNKSAEISDSASKRRISTGMTNLWVTF